MHYTISLPAIVLAAVKCQYAVRVEFFASCVSFVQCLSSPLKVIFLTGIICDVCLIACIACIVLSVIYQHSKQR